MRKHIVFALLLTIVVQGAWAYTPSRLKTAPTEGPWTYNAVSNGTYGSKGAYSFDELNHNAWEANWDDHDNSRRAYQWQDVDGTGFTMKCRSSWEKPYYGVFSTYKHSETVEPYTVKRLTWDFKISGRSQKASQTTALYARDDLEALKSMKVDFSGDYSNQSGKTYCIGNLVQPNYPNAPTDKTESTAQLTKTFDFDNSDVDTTRIITWGLMLTHVVYNSASTTFDMIQWGGFKDFGWSVQTLYYKHVTYNANGGEGIMDPQKIENNGNLTANAFTRTGYTFAGWATSTNGEVEYADGESITVNNSNKGRITLYAVWNIVNYTISYTLNGGSADNPTSYTVETPTFTLNDPTKADYTFLGWTIKSSDDPQMEVTIEQGSTGNKTYTANWIHTAVLNVRTLINAIGTVEYTPESKAKIDAARAAYDALQEEKSLMTAAELETLQAAEATYAALEPSTINFVKQDSTTTIESKENIVLYYPAAPEVQDKTFTHWQTVEKNVSEDKTIVIQPVYTPNE